MKVEYFNSLIKIRLIKILIIINVIRKWDWKKIGLKSLKIRSSNFSPFIEECANRLH